MHAAVYLTYRKLYVLEGTKILGICILHIAH